MHLSRTESRQNLLITILVGVVLFLAFFIYFTFRNPIQNDLASLTANTTALDRQKNINFGLPVRLKIPGINVDAVIESVGLTSDGAMDTPKIPEDVAWFNPGPYPGENGSAVITGHYGKWKNGKGSVFDNLYKLRQGDKLYIENDKGITISFVVRESRNYDPGANASDVFSSNDGKSHLNLITCEGTWNKDSKSYSQRLVVFTDKE